jgi:hypothetical protein
MVCVPQLSPIVLAVMHREATRILDAGVATDSNPPDVEALTCRRPCYSAEPSFRPASDCRVAQQANMITVKSV